MGISINTAFRWKNEFIDQLVDCYRRALDYGWDSERLYARIRTAIWEQPRYQKLPPWAKGELTGFDKALNQRIWYELTESRVFLEGRFIPNREVPQGRAYEVVDLGITVWKHMPWMVWNYTKTEHMAESGKIIITDIPTAVTKVPCGTCGGGGWVKLCQSCQAPLCGRPDCEVTRPGHYTVCCLCAGEGLMLDRLADIGYQLHGTHSLGPALAKSRWLIPLLINSYPRLAGYLADGEYLGLDSDDEAGQIQVMLLTDRQPRDACDLLERIDNEWYLGLDSRTRHVLSVNISHY